MRDSSKLDSAPSTGRMAWIDVAKGLAILLVVYRHVFEGLSRAGLPAKEFSYLEHANILFFSFRMPLFFIVAGLFVSKGLQARGVVGFIREKSAVILYPFVVWGGLQISLQLLMSSYVNADRSWFSYVDLFLRPRRIDQFWYLLALFNTFVVYAFLRAKGQLTVWQLLAIGLIFYVISAWLNLYQIDLGFVYDLLHFFVFMAIGDAIASWALAGGIRKLVSVSWRFVLILIGFIGSQALFLMLNVEEGKAEFVEKELPVLYLLIALFGAFAIMAISDRLSDTYLGKLFSSIGRYSLQIYVMHVLLASAFRMLMVKGVGVSYVPLLLVAGITVAVTGSIFVARLAERFGFNALFSGKWLLYNRTSSSVKAGSK